MRASNLLSGGATAALLALMPGFALAAVTAEDVWKDWQAQAAAGGQTITATLDRGAGRITLTDVTLSGAWGPIKTAVTVPQVTLLDTAGTVRVQIPDSHVVTRRSTVADETLTDQIALSHPGLDVTASGQPDDITYTYAAPSLTIATQDAPADEADPRGEFSTTIRSLSGTQRVTRQDGQQTTVSATKAAGASGGVTSMIEEGPSTQFEVAEIAYVTRGTVPAGPSDLSTVLRNGEGESHTTHGAASVTITVPTHPAVTARTSGGQMESFLDKGRVAVSSQLQAGEIALVVPDLPEPPAVAFDSLTSSGAFPLVPGDSAPWSAALSLDNLVINDTAWGIFDPQAVLPRDPGQVTLDLSGKVTIPDNPTLSPEAPPFQLETLDVNALGVTLGGAKLTGTGAFTFPEGAVQPAGTADLSLTGGNALLDGLVKIGLVAPTQAMMARMMIGGFTTPGNGPDTLTSRLEFKPDGRITANGRPIR